MSRTNQLTYAIINLLRLKGFMAWRNNSGVATYGTRVVAYGCEGSADILALDRSGRFYGIEVKVGRDKLSLAQRHWHQQLKEHCGISIVAKSVDDVLAVIDPKERKAA